MKTKEQPVLKAFHGKKSIKNTYLRRLDAHYKADEIIHGTYWQDGKGCAVGCTVHSDDHNAYEKELGIPAALAHLEDRIFEGLTNGKAKEFPTRFLSAIRPGADLNSVADQFKLWLLQNEMHFNREEWPQVAASIDTVIGLYERLLRQEAVQEKEWEEAESAARSAARSAESAALSAAWSAEFAARSAAWSAESAAWSAARSAAWSAARSAARSAESAAWSAAYERMADKLIELLEAA